MILDNSTANTKKIHEWIYEYTEAGAFDAVTGYFTIGALAWLSEKVNDRVAAFRFVIGDIASRATANAARPLDLLNERATADTAFGLATAARKAVEFLRQDKVLAKTVEPNFCHAKCLVFKPAKNVERNSYYIAGSSNLTEAGIGLKRANNVELNLTETGGNYQYKDLVRWFDALWEKPETRSVKTIAGPGGVETKINFKEYLIAEISKVFAQYTPLELYMKVLSEFFPDDPEDPAFLKQLGRLENTAVWNTLYEFQKKGALSLVKMLQKHGGAILADAVGLGKTFTALAVVKFAEFQGRQIVVVCPKKLEWNWRQYLEHQGSRFESDQFDYFIRFHTDLSEERLETYGDTADKFFTSDKPKLFVIDESHNLRNDKSARYQFFAEKILAKNPDAQVLLLSATPINNSLLDVRNQFKLLAKNADNGFEKSPGVKSVDNLFANAQRALSEWAREPGGGIPGLIAKLPKNFFDLTDALTVARTRPMIQRTAEGENLVFPAKNAPENIFETPVAFGNYENFDDLLDRFPPCLSAYQPAFYAGMTADKAIEDEASRDFFLVRMMFVLLVKRLESSWVSFYQTLESIRDVHQQTLAKIKQYEENPSDPSDLTDSSDPTDLFDEEDDMLFIGRKRKIEIAEIAKKGNLAAFKKDLKKDLDALGLLITNLEIFKRKTALEKGDASADTKLQNLIALIRKKQASGKNNGNPKVLVFTTYTDTADYLYNELRRRGFQRLALVTGTLCKAANYSGPRFEPILERFAPLAKKSGKTAGEPVDILVATDVLSEGQNLQDADFVVNYDIHWNPVRVIQRVGRVDRLGSPNSEIFSANFWPARDVEEYLALQKRVEDRMAVMKLMGSEVPKNFTETFAKKADAPDLESRQVARMLEQMKVSMEDIETRGENFGFNNLSLERFRQDWLYAQRAARENFCAIPNGVFTGFKSETAAPGLVALLGSPVRAPGSAERYKDLRLAYINGKGEPVLSRHDDILQLLATHKDAPRRVSAALETGDPAAVSALSKNLRDWLEKEGLKTATADIVDIFTGTATPVKMAAKTARAEEEFQAHNFELVCWFMVS